ncbi:DUF1786 domain-containing protein [Candidatus Bathyarchaeota archaeon]|nr:DUF1786 domain-containing protein [Candidatus Bathyarchaeota archaeon]
MKILAIDIGAGTQDILLFDSQKKSIENCVKMVLPSPSQVLAAKTREATMLRRDLFIKGDIVGGGAFSFALREHLKSGLRVIMTENAAYTIRNDLDEVKQLGIEVIKRENPPIGFKGEILTIEEVNIRELRAFLTGFGETLSDVDVVTIAVQDHGVFPKGMSNRRFRIQTMRELLRDNPRLENLAFSEEEIPSCFLRMRSAAQASRRQLPKAKVLLMDTSPDAILGCLKDQSVEKANPVLVVNVGNGHTMAAIVSSGEVKGVMEHHTHLLNSRKIEQLLIDFADGRLTDEKVFEDNGHGLFLLSKPPGFSKIEMVATTGPNRNILAKTDLPVHFAAPAGDVMMTGPIGLVEAVKRKFKLE